MMVKSKLAARGGLMGTMLCLALIASPAMAQDDGGGMPAAKQQGMATYVTGGVGLDESKALRANASKWPLALQFTGPGSDYLSDVHVRITDSKNADALSVDADGPYMLVKLPAGKYTVQASYKGKVQSRPVDITGSNHQQTSFHWMQQ